MKLRKTQILPLYLGALAFTAFLLPNLVGAQTVPAPGSKDASFATPTDQGASLDVPDVLVSSPQQVNALQSQPVSATVVTSDLLEATRSNNLLDAQELLPSLQVDFGNSRNLAINVRGFGSSSSGATNGTFGGTPVYVDGIYQTRPGQATLALPDLNGIAVLKGPQGTAGGMDSIGGTVNLTTALPTFTPEGKLSFTYGRYNTIQAKGTVSGPIAESDKVAFRISFITSDRQGYIYNVNGGQHYNDEHNKAIRAQVLLEPVNDLTIRVIGDYAHQNQACCIDLFDGAVYNYTNGAAVKNNAWQRAARVRYKLPGNELSSYSTDITGYQQTASDSYGVSALINYKFNGVLFDSTTSFRAWDFHPDNLNSNPIGLNITDANNDISERSVTQEFRITTPNGRPIEATAGLFFLHDQLYDWLRTVYGPNAGIWLGNPTTAKDIAIDNAAYNGLNRLGYNNPKSDVIAPYIRGVWHATSDFDITLGSRYSYTVWSGIYSQSVAGPSLNNYGLSAADLASAGTKRASLFAGGALSFPAATHQGLVSGLATASYKFSPTALGYVTYSHGARAGGVNLVQAAHSSPEIKPEEVDNYEIGVKSTFLDQRLVTNLAAFVMADHNYITTVTVDTGGTSASYLANAKQVVSRGIEADVQAKPIDQLSLFGSLTYNDAFYKSFASAPCPYEINASSCDRSGMPISHVPKWKASVGGELSNDLGHILPFAQQTTVGYLEAIFTYHSKYFSDTADSIYSVISANALINLNAGLRLADGSWDLKVWIKNATDHHYFTTLSPANLSSGIISGQVGVPFMVGMTISATL
jgi:iron complex outermembrane receptor protein